MRAIRAGQEPGESNLTSFFYLSARFSAIVFAGFFVVSFRLFSPLAHGVLFFMVSVPPLVALNSGGMVAELARDGKGSLMS